MSSPLSPAEQADAVAKSDHLAKKVFLLLCGGTVAFVTVILLFVAF